MYANPQGFSFADMLSNDFDTKLMESNMNNMGGDGTNNMTIPVLPFLQTENPDLGSCIPPPSSADMDSWLNDITGKTSPHKRRPTPNKIKISRKDIPLPVPQSPMNPPAPSIDDKKMTEKEKHKERQRQRRQKMTGTMSQLKSMIPECVKREAEAAEGKKKMKVDQTQLLEMTVDYIQELKNTINHLEQENHILRACVENSHNSSSDLSGSDTSHDVSSPDQSPNSIPAFYEDFHSPPSSTLLSKRSLSNLYQGNIESRPAKQPVFVRTARVLMAIFVVGLIFYNPISFPSSVIPDSGPAIGRVLQSTGKSLVQSSSSSWVVYLLSSFVVKIVMLMFWTFGAMLLDHVHVPSSDHVKLAKRENDIGVKKYDRGDYQGSRRHFEKAMTYLGRSPRPSLVARVFHLPLEMWRQVLHLLRIGLWCDGFLVHLRGGQEAMLETARCNHYLFSLNMLANNLDGFSVLYFLVSLNAAESLYQKPPVLAEVYATVAIAFYGLLKMPKAYQYLMGKAWNIVDNFQEKSNESSVDNTKAYLLFLSSYGSLCDGNLQQVQTQIQRGCDLFLKKGNKNMFFQGQFFISYTHFLRGNYFTTMQIMKSIEVCNLGDIRISWWREVLINCCKLCLHDTVTEKDLTKFEILFSKVESHSTFAPSMLVLQQSVLALMLLRLGHRDRALGVAIEALDSFEDSSFIGWIFYCGYYISEVFFTVWEEEKQNKKLTNQISRLTHRLCNCLRRVAKSCELARPITFLVIGRYTLNMKQYAKAVDYLEQAAESADDCSLDSYKIQASWLIDRAEFELKHADEPECLNVVIHSLFMLLRTRLPFLCARCLPFSTNRFVNTSVSDREKDISRVKRIIEKEGLKKKMKRRLQAEVRHMELTNKIQSGQTKEKSPDQLSIREQFKQLPFEPKTLDYIRKHSLHRSKEIPNIRQRVNSFVDGVFDTDRVRVRVCKTEDRYPEYPEGERHPEVALVGRSNAGKSSILRALLPRLHLSKAPKISHIPGQTRAIHFIQLQDLTLVDLPGYGYSVKENKVEQWNDFTQKYLTSRPKLRRICVLIDSRHGLKPADWEYLEFLEENKKKYQIILTKADLVEPEDMARIYTQVKDELEKKKFRACLDRVMMVSSLTNAGIPLFKKELASLAYKGPQKMERGDFLRIGESKPEHTRIGYGVNSQLRNQHVTGRRGRISLQNQGRAGRPRR